METHNSTEGVEEVAQYVIDNRYPKSEQEKVSDLELYHYVLEGFHQELQKARVEAYKEAGNFVGELYQSGNMGDNEYALLTEFFDEKLKVQIDQSELDQPTL